MLLRALSFSLGQGCFHDALGAQVPDASLTVVSWFGVLAPLAGFACLVLNRADRDYILVLAVHLLLLFNDRIEVAELGHRVGALSTLHALGAALNGLRTLEHVEPEPWLVETLHLLPSKVLKMAVGALSALVLQEVNADVLVVLQPGGMQILAVGLRALVLLVAQVVRLDTIDGFKLWSVLHLILTTKEQAVLK